MLAPAEIKKLVKSKISGSHARLRKIVFPFARTADVISCSDAPTLIEGNLIILPFNFQEKTQ